MNSLNPFSTLLASIRRHRIICFVGLICLTLIVIPGFAPVLTPGIDQPSPVGAYLNGIFPSEDPSGGDFSWSLENAFPNLVFVDPMAMFEIPEEDSYYVVEKLGSIYKIPDDPAATTKELVLDIGDFVEYDTDAGLLNGILHPEFGQDGSPNRGYMYVFYRYHPNGEVGFCLQPAFLRLSRFTRPDGEEAFDPDSEFVLMQIFDEHCWHNGGGLFFDEEGYMYISSGDAGGINDTYNNGQKLDERLLSGLLRIDVDMDPNRSHPIRRQQVDPDNKPGNLPSSFSQGYYIPNDNPWQDPEGGVLEEFFAIGLRSPHRVSMDPVTGNIWVGDVGQSAREEISIVPKGGNLEWPFGEGSIPGQKPEPDPLIGFKQPPIYDYGRSEGNAVIGGFVYRGGQFNGALDGRYIFGDHGSRNIWALNPDNGEVTYLTTAPDTGVGIRDGIASFGTNSRGDVFVVRLYAYNQSGGVIYKLKQESSIPDPPQLLSQTGAFSDLETLTPADAFVPYTVNTPLWSDRAEKKRWIAVPNDGTHDTATEQISFSATGSWQFPAGTVFMKHFELPLDYNNPGITTRLETRFIVITAGGGAYGVTYKWNEAGTDAELLPGGLSVDYDVVFPDGSSGTQTWEFPSRTGCKTCHNANADFVLGVNTWQLNGTYDYPSGITDHQLNTWLHLGLFANPFDLSAVSDFRGVAIDDLSASLEERVRSYLAANCSHCHRPDGVEGAFDARFSTPLENQNIVNTFGISRNTPSGQYIVKPKSTLESELWVRDQSLNVNPMPPLAKNLVDNQYISVLTEWINSMEEGDCTGIPVDSDNDGVCDADDQCPGFDDTIDTNSNGIPDGCECLNPQDVVCPTNDCDFSGDPLSDGGYYAPGQVTSTAWIPTAGIVTLKAGQSISLQPGFRVDAGGTFSALILECEPEVAIAPESATDRQVPDPPGGSDIAPKPAVSIPYQFDLDVKIWPLPFREAFNLQIAAPTPEMKRATIQITDQHGRLIYQRFDAPFEEVITIQALRNWASGTYFIRVHGSNYYFTQPLVKQ